MDIIETLQIQTETASQLKEHNLYLASSVEHWFERQQKAYENRPEAIWSTEQKKWTWQYVNQFLLSRAQRAEEVRSDEIAKAQDLARIYFGERNHHFAVGCLDGRIMPAIKVSHLPHVGGWMRTQGGELHAFQPSTTGGVRVNYDSYEVHQIENLLFAKAGGAIHYSLDSHFECAAQGRRAASKGICSDGGLAGDIREKMLAARGIIAVRNNLIAQGASENDLATIHPQFFSYNPTDGTLTMGLELYIDSETVKENGGYAPEVLAQLKEEKRIMDAWEFINDSEIADNLANTVKDADFRTRYAQSMLDNWKAITELYADGQGDVYRAIYERLASIYQQAEWQIGDTNDVDSYQISRDVLENKAKIMLKNVVTRWSIAKNTQEWPFDEHQEQGIVTTEGGYGPFNGGPDVFSIFAHDDSDPQLDHINLAQGMIRQSRKSGTGLDNNSHGGIVDPFGILEGESFVNAPIVIVNKSIMRTMPEDGWELLQGYNLDQIFSQINWENSPVRKWHRENIASLIRPYLQEVPSGVVEEFINGVYEIFDRMRNIMFDTRFTEQIINGNMIVVNLLVDGDRMPQMVVPLVA